MTGLVMGALIITGLIVYLTAGALIANALTRRGDVDTSAKWGAVMFAWLPAAVIHIIFKVLTFLLQIPGKFIDSQFEKHSK